MSPSRSKSDEVNEDPVSVHHPQNNARNRNEWEANESIRSVNSSTKFSFIIDNESLYDNFKYEKLQLQKMKKSRIPKNNALFDIWLTISCHGIPIVYMNLYAADQVTWDKNTVRIHLNRLSHFHLDDRHKRDKLSNQSKPDALIVLHGDKSMHDFFEFIQYLNLHIPGDMHIPSSFKTLPIQSDLPGPKSFGNKKRSWKKRNRANTRGFTPTLSFGGGIRPPKPQSKRHTTPTTITNDSVLQKNEMMDIELAESEEDNNIELFDARNKYGYETYLDSVHARQRRSVGNITNHSLVQQMQAAARNGKLPHTPNKAGRAAERGYAQYQKSLSSQPRCGKSKGGFGHRNRRTNCNRLTYGRSSNLRPTTTTTVSSEYRAGRSGDQIGFKNAQHIQNKKDQVKRNVPNAISRSPLPKPPKITDMTDLERALAASMKTATDDERRQKRRKKCIQDIDSENDTNNKQSQQVRPIDLLKQQLILIDKSPEGCPSHGLGEHIQFKMKMYCLKCNGAELESAALPPALKVYNNRTAIPNINTLTANKHTETERPTKRRKLNKSKIDWNTEDVSEWLKSLGKHYHQYATEFVDSGVDGGLLNGLDEESLADIVTNKVHLKKIIFSWRKLR
eukprot:749249_1